MSYRIERPYHSIDGKTGAAELMQGPDNKFYFVPYHARRPYKALNFETISDAVKFLDKAFSDMPKLYFIPDGDNYKIVGALSENDRTLELWAYLIENKTAVLPDDIPL